tara:strand:+ start:63750 stop:64337 length:588 start_codon:yes stop_codon:yes gene_type:complete
MNKLNYLTIIGLLVVAFVGTTKSYAQAFEGLDDVPHDISYYRETRVTPPLVKVLYGRPSRENQEVFGNLVPYGEIWRAGYNEATEVKFYKDVQFGTKTVAAGTYVLLAIPGEKEWEIILSSNLDVWGAFQYNPTFDVARVTVPVRRSEPLETLSISFKKKQQAYIEMIIGWDATRVKIPLKFSEESYLAHTDIDN